MEKLTNILLFIVAIILGCILIPLGGLYGALKHMLGISRSKDYSKVFKALAVLIDVSGNVILQELLNDTMIHRSANIKFGDEHDTISFVLGYNKMVGKLTATGRVLASILNKIEKNHVELAVISKVEDLEEYEYLLSRSRG